jgi:uncharacterized protein (TIGR03067 family)
MIHVWIRPSVMPMKPMPTMPILTMFVPPLSIRCGLLLIQFPVRARGDVPQFFLERGIVENVTVYHMRRRASLGQVTDALASTHAVAMEALVGPAQGVWSDDDIVELQDRIVRVHRFLLEDIQAGPLNTTVAQGMSQRLLIDDRPARDIDQIAGRLYQRQALRVDKVACSRGQRAANTHIIRTTEQVVQSQQLNAESGAVRRLGVGIVGNTLEAERFRHAGQFASDISEADDAERAARKSHAQVRESFGPASGTRQAILDEEFVAQGQQERHGRCCHGPTHAIGSDGEHDAVVCAGFDIDIVVTDAKPSDQRQAMRAFERGGGDARRQQEQGVASAHLLRAEFTWVLRQELARDAGLIQQVEADVPQSQAAVRSQKVPGQADVKAMPHDFTCVWKEAETDDVLELLIVVPTAVVILKLPPAPTHHGLILVSAIDWRHPMKTNTSLIAAFAILAILGNVRLAPAGGDKKLKTEVEGSWKLTKGGKGAPKQITFKENKFVLKFDEDRVYEGTFKLNTDENPSWMDMTFTSGPDDYKGKVALCIYNFDAESFNWCAGIPGRKRRPQQFAEVMGDVRLLLGTFERDKK